MVNRRDKTTKQIKEKGSLYGKPLTDREWQVLRLVAQGFTNQEIGTQLWLTTNTIKSHLKRIADKTEIGDRTSLGVWAMARQIRLCIAESSTRGQLSDDLYKVTSRMAAPTRVQ